MTGGDKREKEERGTGGKTETEKGSQSLQN